MHRVVELSVDASGVGLSFEGVSPVDIATIAPDEIRVRIETGVIRGGGRFTAGPGPSEYRGALSFQIGTVRVDAFGILTTGGADGFAVAVVLAAHFKPPIEIAFGFTVNAIGGMVAINHVIDRHAFVQEFTSGALDRLLFPADPMAVADRILTTMSRVLPKRSGGVVIGPMVRLAWGRPVSLVTADLAVIVSVLDPTVLILGRLRVTVPTPNAPVIDLNAELYAEFSAERVLVRARLHHSRLGPYALTGDVGVLVNFAGSGELAIAAGGFHPRFRPLPGLEGMKRLGTDLSPPGLPLRMSSESYVAVTSNTVQTGASVSLWCDADVAELDGRFQFDALAFLSPFRFKANVSAWVTARVAGESFASIRLEGSISGPGRWRLEGRATVEIPVLPDIHVRVEWSWGNGEPPTTAAANPLTIAAELLSDDGAWRARLPDGANRLVTMRRDADPAGVHPFGVLEAHQGAIPLEVHLDRVGSAEVQRGFERVHVSRVEVGATNADVRIGSVSDQFAPAQFRTLSDAEQLGLPAFERHRCGVQVSSSRDSIGSVARATNKWETVNGSHHPQWAWDPASAPHEGTVRELVRPMLGAATRTAAARNSSIGVHMYANPIGSVKLADVELRELRRIADGSRVVGARSMSASEMLRLVRETPVGIVAQSVAVGGVAREHFDFD